MTYLEIYNSFPELVDQGREELNKGLLYLDNLQKEAGEDPESNDSINKTRLKIIERMEFVGFLAGKIQAQLKLLAYHCMDTSIPSDSDVVE